MNQIKLIILLILLPIIGFTQNENKIFKYQKNKVRTVKLSRYETFKYEYKKDLIIEYENSINKVERHYHYSKPELLDSINYFSFYEDKIYTNKSIYKYNDKNKLVRIQFGEDITKNIIKVDSFIYNSDNLVDSILWLSNRTESIFGTIRTDSIRLYAYSAFEYDSKMQLIKESSNQPFGAKEIRYFYDKNGNISKKIEYYGLTRSGCLIGKDKSYSTTEYLYNENGLIEKEIKQNYLVQPNGKKKSNGQYRLKRKYKFD